MTVDFAKRIGWSVAGGELTLKKSAIKEVMETLLNEIERLEGVENAQQQVQPDGADKPLAG